MEGILYKKIGKYIMTDHIIGDGYLAKYYIGFFKNDVNKLVVCKVIPLEKICDPDKVLEK